MILHDNFHLHPIRKSQFFESIEPLLSPIVSKNTKLIIDWSFLHSRLSAQHFSMLFPYLQDSFFEFKLEENSANKINKDKVERIFSVCSELSVRELRLKSDILKDDIPYDTLCSQLISFKNDLSELLSINLTRIDPIYSIAKVILKDIKETNNFSHEHHSLRLKIIRCIMEKTDPHEYLNLENNQNILNENSSKRRILVEKLYTSDFTKDNDFLSPEFNRSIQAIINLQKELHSNSIFEDSTLEDTWEYAWSSLLDTDFFTLLKLKFLYLDPFNNQISLNPHLALSIYSQNFCIL